MVGTRNHPKDFVPPAVAETPVKRTTRASTSNDTTQQSPPPVTSPPATSSKPRTYGTSLAPYRRAAIWSHTPSNLTLIWLAISLPLVIWDTGYVALRPYSMPGGFLHAPIWSPYGLYGNIDHTYGFVAWNAKNGFTAAQGSINAVETLAYMVYLYLVYKYGQQEETQGRGAPDKDVMASLKTLSESRTVHGKMAAWVTVLAFTTANITFWKTVIYWLNEAFSGFSGVGHNDWVTLFFMWIIPNGAWLVFPAYMIYVFGQEILQGLAIAAGDERKVR